MNKGDRSSLVHARHGRPCGLDYIIAHNEVSRENARLELVVSSGPSVGRQFLDRVSHTSRALETCCLCDDPTSSTLRQIHCSWLLATDFDSRRPGTRETSSASASHVCFSSVASLFLTGLLGTAYLNSTSSRPTSFRVAFCSPYIPSSPSLCPGGALTLLTPTRTFFSLRRYPRQ